MNNENPIGVLKLYSQKVSGEISEVCKMDKSMNLWRFDLSFMQYGMPNIEKSGYSVSKKDAKKDAAMRLMQEILVMAGI